ncbi:MAG: hypothetical protein M5U28_24260 [Sandaracinaceae bacterium]|nr:hypothetical protein [Sandaracinaceae bacterium]
MTARQASTASASHFREGLREDPVLELREPPLEALAGGGEAQELAPPILRGALDLHQARLDEGAQRALPACLVMPEQVQGLRHVDAGVLADDEEQPVMEPAHAARLQHAVGRLHDASEREVDELHGLVERLLVGLAREDRRLRFHATTRVHP